MYAIRSYYGELHLLDLSVREVALDLPAGAPPDETVETPSGSPGFQGLALPLSLRIDRLALQAS